MSWIDEFASRFSSSRIIKERIKELSIATLPIEVQYLALVLTGTVTNHFYMSKEETIELSRLFHIYMKSRDQELMKEIIKRARERGVKDQVLMGAYYLNDLPTLSTLPPSQIEKLKEWNLGSKRYTKRIIKDYLSSLSIEALEYYARSHRKALKSLLFTWSKSNGKYVPYCGAEIPRKIMNILMNPIKMENSNEVDFNYLVSTVPKSKWRDYREKIVISPYALISYAKSLSQALGESWVADRLTMAKYLTSDKFFIAAIALRKAGFNSLAKKISDLYSETVRDSYNKLILKNLMVRKIVLVLDVSGSMREYYYKVMSTVSPFAPIIKHLVLFSYSYYEEDPVKLYTIEGIDEIKGKAPWGGTNIREALIYAKSISDPFKDLIVIVTDEQENMRLDLNLEMPNIIINPGPYPSHLPLKNVYYIPARNAETLSCSLKFIQIVDTKNPQDIINSLNYEKG